jgi:hypothetical protein
MVDRGGDLRESGLPVTAWRLAASLLCSASPTSPAASFSKAAKLSPPARRGGTGGAGGAAGIGIGGDGVGDRGGHEGVCSFELAA